ncbi:class I SAM-dependent methyltransferase [Planctomycetales bacterium ZRK34]|nr:class I SAM-dependent methyltransferase [Planctomycetales bacterium ZRK34]
MSTDAFPCRSCGHDRTQTILSLGHTPLANALLKPEQLDQPEERFDLQLVYCPQCSLVQIDETVPPEKLFSDYLYFSSFSDTMVKHARQLAERMIAQQGLGADSLVIEPASNDGYLLQHYRNAGVPVLGVEPAGNIAEVARKKGIDTLNEFFSADLAQRLAAEGRRADVMHAHNVMAHVADLNGFVAGIAALLKPTGVFVLEAPYVLDMVDHVEFDTIYHEHLCYFSLTALKALFERHGLYVVHVEYVPIHGGTIQVHAAPRNEPDATVAALLQEEHDQGLDSQGYYSDFADRVEQLKQQLVDLLTDLKARGSSIAAYGASAKGSTLLNYFGIDGKLLDFVADRSTYKQGLYTPGTHLPILSPDALLERQPDYVLLLTWNFRDEILAQQDEYRKRGGQFIIPVPKPEVV